MKNKLAIISFTLTILYIIDKLIPKSKSKKSEKYVNELFEDLDGMLKGVFLLRELTPRTLDYLTSFGERLSCFIISEALNSRRVKSEFLNASGLVKTDSNFTYAKVNFSKTNKNIQDYFKKQCYYTEK